MSEVLNILEQAEAAKAGAADAYQEAKEEFGKIEAAYRKLYGLALDDDAKDTIMQLLKTFGPKAAMVFGGPAAGAAVTGMLADEGSFSGLFGGLSKIFGLG